MLLIVDLYIILLCLVISVFYIIDFVLFATFVYFIINSVVFATFVFYTLDFIVLTGLVVYWLFPLLKTLFKEFVINLLQLYKVYLK